MASCERGGARRAVRAAATALSVGVAALVGAGKAAAVPVAVEFDHGVLDLGVQKGVQFISPAGEHATLAIDQDPGTGAFTTAAPGDLSFPSYSFTDPVPGEFNLSALTPISDGAFDAATGQMSFSVQISAAVTLVGNDCVVEPIPLTLSTEATAPYRGVRYSGGSITGEGAVAASWTELPVPDTPECDLVDQFGNGPGGIWLSRGISLDELDQAPTPVEPRIAIKVIPKKRRARAGKKTRVRARVVNLTEHELPGATLCAKAPKRLGLIGGGCRNFNSIAGYHEPGSGFKLRPKARGRYRIRFEATAPGAEPVTASARVRVKRKR